MIHQKLSLSVILPFVLLMQNTPARPELGDVLRTPSAQSFQISSSLPLYFIQNDGQLESNTLYHIKMSKGNAYFSKDNIIYQFINEIPSDKQNNKSPAETMHPHSPQKVEVENIQVQFLEASREAKVIGLDQSSSKFNFYHGKSRSNWIIGSDAYHKIKYQDLYPGIDLYIFEDHGLLKQEFHVRDGGSVESVAVQYQGAQGIQVNEDGQLEIQTESLTLLEDTPVSYQIIDGKRILVETEYVVEDGNIVRFKIGDYSPNDLLVIDPSLLYSTFLGGSAWDRGEDIVVDLNLNAYVVGSTDSTNFPKTPGAYDREKNDREAFIAKLDPTGSKLLYATYFGGSEWDSGESLSFSWSDESVVIAGGTLSDDLPTTPGAYDRTLDGRADIFIAKFNSNGRLTFSTYFGGDSSEWNENVAVDGAGNIFLAGNTSSSDLDITPGAIDSTFDEYHWNNYTLNFNIFVSKFSPSGKNLKYCTFYGTYDLAVSGIAVDFGGHAYVTGATYSGSFPTTEGAYCYDTWIQDGFILKLNPEGTAVEYATLINAGGDMMEYWVNVNDIDLDGGGNAFVTGSYRDKKVAWWQCEYCETGFVFKFNPDGSRRLFDFFFFGDGVCGGSGVALDGRGAVYMLADTDVDGLKTSDDALQDKLGGGFDLYIAKLDEASGDLIYATYLGGSESEFGAGIAADSYGSIYITGYTESVDFPTTPGSYDRIYSGNGDAFVSRLRDSEAAGKISLTKENLKFKFAKGATSTRSKGFRVANQGSGKVAYQVAASPAWVVASPSSGEVKVEKDLIEVTVDPTKLKPGLHKGVVTVASVDAFNSPQTLAVFLRIKGPRIKLKQDQYSFTGVAGEAEPTPQVCRIRNSGKGELRYKIRSQNPWLSSSSSHGKSTGEWDDFEIRVDNSGLSPGIYQGTILITSKDTVDTAEITVNLNLNTPNNIE